MTTQVESCLLLHDRLLLHDCLLLHDHAGGESSHRLAIRSGEQPTAAEHVGETGLPVHHSHQV